MSHPICNKYVEAGKPYGDEADFDMKAVWAAEEIDRLKAENTALSALNKLPDNICLSCGGTGGHAEGCPGTTALIALAAENETAKILLKNLLAATQADMTMGPNGYNTLGCRCCDACAKRTDATNDAYNFLEK